MLLGNEFTTSFTQDSLTATLIVETEVQWYWLLCHVCMHNYIVRHCIPPATIGQRTSELKCRKTA